MLLAEGEADEVAAFVDVVVHDHVGHGGHADPLGQAPAELDAVVMADGADVGGDEVGAGRLEDFEAGRAQAC